LNLDILRFPGDFLFMPRKVRLEYPGAIYHVMSRGDQRQDIFLDDVDRHDFIKTHSRGVPKNRLANSCVLPHAQPLPPRIGDSQCQLGLRHGLAAEHLYDRLNHRHKLTGHVLSGRYKAQMVDGSGTGYFRTACDYVHLNPVRAQLLAPGDRLVGYPWSSFPLYLASGEHRPRWVRAERLLGEHGIQQDTPAGRQEFERHMERRRLEETNQEALEEFRQAWWVGSETFRRECLERMEGKVGENHPVQARLEAAEAKAQRMVAEELARLQWTQNDLVTQQKSHPLKLALAARLRRETTLSVKQIAALLHLGKPKGARTNLQKFMHAQPGGPEA
jgi:hypothetical protein